VGLNTAPLARWVQEAMQAAKHLEIRLRPRWQEGTTLNVALSTVAHDFEKRTGHPVLFRCSPHDILLDRPKGLALVRLLEEALVHAVAHSRASRMEVWLSVDEAGVRLGIQDNGMGRAEAEPDSNAALSFTSWNLQLRRFQGSLQVMAIPADGTLVVIRLPAETGSNLAVRSVC
jgi:two-component system, NarL family, sensor histidine kinase UhpB